MPHVADPVHSEPFLSARRTADADENAHQAESTRSASRARTETAAGSEPVLRVREVVDVNVVRSWLRDGGEIRTVLTEAECHELEGRPDPAAGIAARLAGKAAVVAALAQPRDASGAELPGSAVEILHGDHGEPSAHLRGDAASAMAVGSIHVSLSHDGDLAAALVVHTPPSSDDAA